MASIPFPRALHTSTVAARRAASLPVVLLWTLIAGALLVRGWGFVVTGASPDPDSIMRMLQVRDLLGGQGWFDLHQYRIGPADSGGVAMHWSRLADLVPALLVTLLTPVTGMPRALVWAQALTPLLLLLPALAFGFATARALAPDKMPRSVDLPFAISWGTALAMLTLFVPGDVDHHNLQLVAVLMLLAGACATPTVRSGVVAGVAVTLAMTIGLETAPHVAAVLGVVTLRWVLAPAVERRFMRGLALGQIVSALVSLGVFMPRASFASLSSWPSGQCDSWTPALFCVVLGSGVLFLAASAVTWSSRLARAALFVVGGTALLGLVAVAYPACLHHPAGSDPLLWRYWMDGITENEPVAGMIGRGEWTRAAIHLGSTPIVLVAGVTVALRLTKLGASRAWWPLIAAAAAALLVTMLHVRGAPMLWGLAAVLAAASIAHARPAGGWRMLAAWIVLPPVAVAIAAAALGRTQPPPPVDLQLACTAPRVIAALNALPTGGRPTTLVVPITAEPMILTATPHRSLGATYHRNARGNHLLITAMLAAPDEARAALVKGGARYLLYCPGYDISASYRRGNPTGLAAALTVDRPPAWLRPLASFRGDVRLYAVD